MPLRVPVTSGVTADCTKASDLIRGFPARSLPADRGYDSNAILKKAREEKMQVAIPPKKNRKEQREYDQYLYKIRHPVENAFLHLKGWKGVAARYAKNTSSYPAIVPIRRLFLRTQTLSRHTLIIPAYFLLFSQFFIQMMITYRPDSSSSGPSCTSAILIPSIHGSLEHHDADAASCIQVKRPTRTIEGWSQDLCRAHSLRNRACGTSGPSDSPRLQSIEVKS